MRQPGNMHFEHSSIDLASHVTGTPTPAVETNPIVQLSHDAALHGAEEAQQNVPEPEQVPVVEPNIENNAVPPQKNVLSKVQFTVVAALGAHEKKVVSRDAWGNEVTHIHKSKDVFEIEQNDFAQRRLTESKDKWDPKALEGLTGWQKFGKKAERVFDRIWRGTVTEDVHFAKEKALGTELSAIAGVDSAITEEFHAVIDKGARERLKAERKTGWEKFSGGVKDAWAEMRGARKDLHRHELAITQELRQKYDADPTNSDPIENPLYALINRDVSAREALAARVNESDLELLKQTNVGDKKTVEAIKLEGEKGKKVDEFLKKEIIGKAIDDFVTRAEAGETVVGINGKLRRELDVKLQDYFMTSEFQDWVKTLPAEQQAMFENSFTYASDMLLQTEEVMMPVVMENLDHYKTNAKTDFEMELCLGTAQLSANTEAKKDGWFTKERASKNQELMDKLRGERNHSDHSSIYNSTVIMDGLRRDMMLGYAKAIYKNEALMAWTAAATLKGVATAARAGMSWMPVLGSAGVAGTLSGLKEWARMDKQRATYGFGLANGLEFPIADKAVKSAEFRAADYNRIQLSDRTQQFQEVINKIKDGSADANTLFMGMVYAADSQARLKLNNERNINLLTASVDGPTGRGIHARELRIHDKARSAVMGKLAGALAEGDNLNNVGEIFGMLPGEVRDFRSLMDTLTEAQYNNLLSGTKVSGPLKAAITNVDSKLQVEEAQAIRVRDELYNGLHWRSSLTHAGASAAITTVAGFGLGQYFNHEQTINITENHTVVLVDHDLPVHEDVLPTAKILDNQGNLLAETHSWLPSGTHLVAETHAAGAGYDGETDTFYNLVTDNVQEDQVLLHNINFGSRGEIINEADLAAEMAQNHITFTPHELAPVGWDTEGGTEIDYTQWNNTLHYKDFPNEDIDGFFANNVNASLAAHPEISASGETLTNVERVTDVNGLRNLLRGMENWVYNQENFKVNQIEGYNRILHSEDTMWSELTGHQEVISEGQSASTDILHLPDLIATQEGNRRVVDLIHEAVRENPTNDIHHQFSDEAHRIAWEMSYWGDEAHIPDAKETFTLLEYFGEIPTAGDTSSVIPVENYFAIDHDITRVVPVNTGEVYTQTVADWWTSLGVGYARPLEEPSGRSRPKTSVEHDKYYTEAGFGKGKRLKDILSFSNSVGNQQNGGTNVGGSYNTGYPEASYLADASNNAEGQKVIETLSRQLSNADRIYISLGGAVGDAIIGANYVAALSEGVKALNKNIPITVVINDEHRDLFAQMGSNINIEVAKRGEAKNHIQELANDRSDMAPIIFDFEHYSNNRPQMSQVTSNGKTITTVNDLFAPAIQLYNNETDGERKYTHFIEEILGLNQDLISPDSARFKVSLPINNDQIYRSMSSRYGIDRNKEQVGIVVEASIDEKRYPMNRWIELIQKLAAEKPAAEYSIIYNENSGNANFSKAAINTLLATLPSNLRRKVHLVSGNLSEITSVISHQNVLISNDTGLAHLGANLESGPKVVSLHVPRFSPNLWVSNSNRQKGIISTTDDIASIDPATIVENIK
jgi:ADP-heptose:LPS heptosyltransferase